MLKLAQHKAQHSTSFSSSMASSPMIFSFVVQLVDSLIFYEGNDFGIESPFT